MADPTPTAPSERSHRHRSGARRGLLAIVGVVVVVVAAATCAPPASMAVSTVVDGLDHPWDIAWTPDGTMLFTQRPGSISARIGTQIHQLGGVANAGTEQTNPMMGLAVDPDFATNRYVYACFGTTIAGPLEVRVARWEVSADYTSLSGRTDIITGIPSKPSGDHVGCRAKFGPDGYLWVTTGDADTGPAPQDKQSLAGKVLRVDRNGNGAPGNPGGAFLPQIYSYGHRNPQGIAFRPFDGKVFEVEHGTDCDDEINLLVPGGNYGWDPTTPGGSTDYTEARPMTDKIRHPDALDAAWSSGCPTIAPSGGAFLDGTQWKGMNQSLAVAVLKDEYLRVFYLTPDGVALPQVGWTYFEGTYGRLRTAAQGPDGDLYVLTDEHPGAILRIHPSG